MKSLLSAAIVGVAVVGAFLSGFTWRDMWASRPPSLEAVRMLFNPGLTKEQSPTQIFQDHYNRIVVASAVNVSPKKLKYAGMAGMFSALGDPHTNFLERDDSEILKLETRGDFVGIGARLDDDPVGAKVVTVFKNSPADKAGVQGGDSIIEVDGKSTAGIETNEVVNRIRGKEGTLVRIRVVRAGKSSPLSFTIKRATVVLPSAEGRMLEGTRIAYVNVSGFAQPTTQQLDQAIDDLLAQKPIGFVFDLRSNPGGLLDAAVSMLGRFVEGKPAVTTKRRGGREETLFTPVGSKKDIDVPIMVLINEESASAAEIFAGVLQEYKKATLVGEHSYGKSSVQNVVPLIDLSSAKITIAKYFLPSGRDIGRKLDEDGEYLSGGLRPDFEVVPDYSQETVLGTPEKDTQLKKAIDIIKLRMTTRSQLLPTRPSPAG